MEAIFVGQIFDLDVLGKRFALGLELLDLVAAVQAMLGSVQLALDIVLSPRLPGVAACGGRNGQRVCFCRQTLRAA